MGRIPSVKGKKMAKKSALSLSRPPPKKRIRNQNTGKKKNNKNEKNGSKRARVPRLPYSLQKELDVSHPEEDAEEDQNEGEKLHGDEYEYEEDSAQEETKKNKRYDQVDNLEYELPSDFEDEEIDEDNAFGDEHLDLLEDDLVEKGRGKVGWQGELMSHVDLNSDEEDGMSKSEELSGESEHETDSDKEDSEHNQMISRREQLGILSEEEDEEEQEGEEEAEQEEDDDERHQRMLQDVTGGTLDTFKGKKRRKKVIVSEAHPESEYNLDQKASGPTQSLTVEDLMAPLYGNSGFGSLRKRMQQLEKNSMPVQAPLPKVMQERLERKAAYENTKEDIKKWQPLVKRNREASTINLVKREDMGKTGTGAIAYGFRPTTDLEKDIASLLQDTRVAEAQIKDGAELLELNKVTVEDVRDRQGRLAKMRSLMFHHELKAKHIKKIKSKTFHRLLKKERTKAALRNMPDDPEAAKEYALKQEFKRAEERMTLRHKNTSKWAKRVLERGLQTQDEGTRAAIAEQLRLNTLLSRKIHSMNDGSSSDESSSEDDDNTELPPGSDDKPKSQIIAKAKEETLKLLEGEEEEIPTSGILSLPFMVRGMEKRKKQAQDEALAALGEYESALMAENGDADGRDEDNDAQKGRLLFGELNRQNSIRKSHRESKTEFEDMLVDRGGGSEGDSEDDMDQDLAQMYNSTKSMGHVKTDLKTATEEHNLGFNGLHTMEDSVGPLVTKTSGPVLVGGSNHADRQDKCTQMKFSSEFGSSDLEMESAEKMVACKVKKSFPSEDPNSDLWLFGERGGKRSEKLLSEINAVPARKQKKRKNKKKQENEDRLISNMEEKKMRPNHVVSIAGSAKVDADKIDNINKEELSEPGKSNEKLFGVNAQNPDKIESGCDSEEEPGKEAPSAGMTLIDGFGSQTDLIQRAFAGDDVEAEFEQAKAEALNEEVPASEVVDSLPGWGQWTHIQQKKGLPSWILQQQEEEKRKREEALRKRKDAKLKFVVISEKADKKAAKYNTPSLPFPYQSREVFERSMRMPIGPEFNPIRAFENMIRPAVIKKPGVVIDPIEYKEEQTEKGNLHSVASLGKQKRSGDDYDKNPKKMPKRSSKGQHQNAKQLPKRFSKGHDHFSKNVKLKGLSNKVSS